MYAATAQYLTAYGFIDIPHISSFQNFVIRSSQFDIVIQDIQILGVSFRVSSVIALYASRPPPSRDKLHKSIGRGVGSCHRVEHGFGVNNCHYYSRINIYFLSLFPDHGVKFSGANFHMI